MQENSICKAGEILPLSFIFYLFIRESFDLLFNLTLITGFRHLVPLWFLLCLKKTSKTKGGMKGGLWPT
jgi:hypothetical protein